MKATRTIVFRDQYGGFEAISIKEDEIPSPKPNEILIENRVSTVNRTDCANLTAHPFIMRFSQGLLKPKEPILGTDYAGVVLQVGERVKQYRIGDRVCGFNDAGIGSQSTHFCVKENAAIIKLPTKLNFKEGAASLEGAHYAHAFVEKSKLAKGDFVFVNGGTGAIGSALIQFAKAAGARIWASCRREHTEIVRSLGAERCIDYTKEDFTECGQLFDKVFDAVGKSTFGKCQKIMKKNSIYISSELGPYAQNIFYALWTARSNNKKVIFPIPYKANISFPFIQQHIETDQFRPLIEKVYPVMEASKAYEYVLTGQKAGNVLLTFT